MKKLITLVFVLALMLSLVGCASPQKETVMFNGQTFDKADLSKETLEWLEWYNELTEDEQLAVDYIPADLCGNINAEGVTNKWGITLEAENVSSKGMTLVCYQSGGEDVFDLNTGSFYSIQKFENSQWVDITNENSVWTSEAWLIQKGGTTQWDINWVGYCGELSAGEYRIAKPISNFRGTGDYDTEIFYAEFVIN